MENFQESTVYREFTSITDKYGKETTDTSLEIPSVIKVNYNSVRS